MKTIEQVSAVVEEALLSLGITPEQARNEEEGQWTVYREVLEIYMDAWTLGTEQQALFYFQADDQPVFQVICPFCQVPADQYEEFLEELLDVNIALYKVSLAVRQEGGVVCVKYRSLAQNLTKEEVLEALDAVAYYAELFSNVFREKYGVQILERQD
ncbi:MAG: YbjN domain-containing protein [Bacteroidota bacterium]|nr:YbjN domain-containing protein [Bacteroidota bacterium]MDX5431564.1 YbjN domain-containing protein [Bacteroidota bacterium]MDX5470285.1 YbjN domain-containing protein [Bacteroidota bacterium]